MKVSESFNSSKYLSASDVPTPMLVTMVNVLPVELNEKTKFALQFGELPKSLVLNKTNANAIAQLHGDDSTGWPGRQMEIYSTTTMYQGQNTPCLRLRPPQLAVQQAVVQQPVAVPTPSQAVAPNGQQQYSQPAPTPPQAPVQAPPGDVPFDA